MADIRITSDTHLGHRLVAGLRGFDDVAAHDDRIIGNLAEGATEDTVWWFLGDIVFGDRPAGLRRLREQVPGRKRLVLGNHDPIHPYYARQADWEPWRETFEQIHLHAKIRHDGFRLLLTHFSYEGFHPNDDRFAQWRLRDNGAVAVHGHTHGQERTTRSTQGSLQVHVGLDAWHLRPVTPDEILADLARHEDLSSLRSRQTNLRL
ncbi:MULTISPECIES: metallophosphoesterase family protein [unclassified Luteococcus]|uniref:metallophosphoesterase family protein n=1 Tax=unclassified Luteococcus TaxID=2639923 RepID=UPI00313AF388